MSKPQRRKQIRRYLLVLDSHGAEVYLTVRGPYKTDTARTRAAHGMKNKCFILDVPFHKAIHLEDRRPFVDEVRKMKFRGQWVKALMEE